MFDFHMHSKISFDSTGDPLEMIKAAEAAELKEICFTDHYDFNDVFIGQDDLFSMDEYRATYEVLKSNSVKLRRGAEFGLTPWNTAQFKEFAGGYNFDFIIGSVHCVDGYDPYFKEFWEQGGSGTAFERYLLKTLECVKVHDGFDVLGHINYVCKSEHNPTHSALKYADFSELSDEIMRTVAQKGIGMEINTSGIDRVSEPLPSLDYIKRFRELGGEIITVGSDAHDSTRVGQHIDKALDIAREVFGYVCTFEGRKPIFHKL